MGINLVVAVTDSDWFNLLRRQPLLKEVNFWAPSDKNFRALQPGELFLFKLHAPINKIVGGGVFAYATSLPLSLAWESFGIANGAETLVEMRSKIREEFESGRHYYALHGQVIAAPRAPAHRPDAGALAWHNEKVYKG